MSRIGKLPIVIPRGVNVEINKSGNLLVKGSKGKLELTIHPSVTVETENGTLLVKPKLTTKEARSVHGLVRSLIANMVVGVSTGYTKNLEIIGIGYRANTAAKVLTLSLGFSHQVQYQIPEGIDISVDKQTKISIQGIDKQKVGQVAAEIRSLKPPEPYKGKGIRYEGEFVKKKVGKSGA